MQHLVRVEEGHATADVVHHPQSRVPVQGDPVDVKDLLEAAPAH